MIPTLHPFASTKRFHDTIHGLEAEMTNDEAVACLDESIDPSTQEWWELNNQASALYLTGHTERALLMARQALSMKRAVPVLVNLAVILETLGRFEEALPYAREACQIDLGDDRAYALYGESLLRMGWLAEGWPYYAQQRAAHDWLRPYLPEWAGPSQDLNGKRVLVIEGGGYGDNIYFLRWLDGLKKWGASIHYICQPSFAPLVRRCGFTPIENWAGNIDIRFSDYDCFVSVLALGWKLGVTFENYRWTGPYIRGGRWSRLGRSRKRIGLCWRAGEGRSPRKQRSLSDAQLKRLTDALPAPYVWVNLTHVGDAPVKNMVSVDIRDWADTADVVAGLGMVVSVDTAIAHLGGAMGVRTHVLLPGAAAWQWPVRLDRHPMYPSAIMHHNGREGLDNAVEEVASMLEAL